MAREDCHFPFRSMRKSFTCSLHCDLTHARCHFLPHFMCHIYVEAWGLICQEFLNYASPFLPCPSLFYLSPPSFSSSSLPFPPLFPSCPPSPPAYLGMEPGTLYMLGKCFIAELHSQIPEFLFFFSLFISSLAQENLCLEAETNGRR